MTSAKHILRFLEPIKIYNVLIFYKSNGPDQQKASLGTSQAGRHRLPHLHRLKTTFVLHAVHANLSLVSLVGQDPSPIWIIDLYNIGNSDEI